MNKLTDKEIETLLKKGILGLLENDNGQEPHAMDIEELIRNSKTTNYSVINDGYKIMRLNVATENKSKMVAIDDPDFWRKVLKDEETPGKILLKEFNHLKETNDFMSEESQREFFLKLNEAVFQYIEKAKSEEINWEEEELFNSMLQQIIDDPFVKNKIKNVSGQLMTDIRKKPRRLKKRELARVSRTKIKVAKKVTKPKVELVEEDSPTNRRSSRRNRKKDPVEVLSSVQGKTDPLLTTNGVKGKRSSRNAKKKGALGKRAVLEEEGLYRNSDSEELERNSRVRARSRRAKLTEKAKKKKAETLESKKAKSQKDRKLKRVKVMDKSVNSNDPLCVFCSKRREITEGTAKDQKDNLLSDCSGCQRSFHLNCLRKQIETSISQSPKDSELLSSERTLLKVMNEKDGKVFDVEQSLCLNCQVTQMDCFLCGSIGNMRGKLEPRVEETVKEVLNEKSRQLGVIANKAEMYQELGTLYSSMLITSLIFIGNIRITIL